MNHCLLRVSSSFLCNRAHVPVLHTHPLLHMTLEVLVHHQVKGWMLVSLSQRSAHGPTTCFFINNVYLKTTTPIISCDCFCGTTAELRDCMAHNTQNIYYPVLFRKSFLTPGLDQSEHWIPLANVIGPVVGLLLISASQITGKNLCFMLGTRILSFPSHDDPTTANSPLRIMRCSRDGRTKRQNDLGPR